MSFTYGLFDAFQVDRFIAVAVVMFFFLLLSSDPILFSSFLFFCCLHSKALHFVCVCAMSATVHKCILIVNFG